MNIQNINNFRSIGGINKNHKKIKEGKLYRCGNLFNVQDEDIAAMRELGIRYVVDIRSEEERQEHPYELPDDFIQLHVSALHTRDGLENFYFFMLIHKNSTSEEIQNAASFVREGYRILPFHNAALNTIFSLMEKDDGAILFHCSSGKDRTGVLAALVQKLLGIDDAYIMQDYMKSNDYVMNHAFQNAEEMGFQGEEKDTFIYCCTVHEELLQSSWDEICDKYTDWESFFLQEYGLNKEKIEQLRSHFLEECDKS